MAPPRRRRRRDSIEQPPNMLSDVIHLKEALNRLHEDLYPELNKQSEKLTDLLKEFSNGYRLAIFVLRGAMITAGIAIVLLVLSFVLIDDDLFLIAAIAAGALSSVAALCTGLGRYKKTQQEKNLKRNIEKEAKEFQGKSSLIIDMLENICQRTEEILRDPWLSEHKTQALSEHFAYCFEKRQLFQEYDSSKVGDRISKIAHLSGNLSGNLSKMIAKVISVPDILKEIIEDNKRLKDKPAKPTREQILNMEFKGQTERFIKDMKKGIGQLKNAVKELNNWENSKYFQ